MKTIFTSGFLGLVISGLLLASCSQMASYENEDLTLEQASADKAGFRLNPFGTTNGNENAMVSSSGNFTLTYTEEICEGDDLEFTFGGVGFTGTRTIQVQQETSPGVWVQVFQQSQAPSGTSGSVSGLPIGVHTFRWTVGGQGGQQNVVFTVTVIDCSVECELEYETAYVGNTVGETDPAQGNGNNGAWWYAFDVDGPATQDVYQKNNKIGSATYDSGNETITISLNSAFNLKDGYSESVKWYSYADGELPTGGRPTPGLAPNKGTSLVIDTNGDRYYVIHLDVQTCVAID